MGAIARLKPISVDDYLTGEAASDERRELVDGYLFAMVGTSQRHNLIVQNLAGAIRRHLRGGPCWVFMLGIKVRVGDNFYYPDLVVSCHPGDSDNVVAPQPHLVVEVLSPSTESRDRFEKRLAYQRLDSLLEYVLVSQHRRRIEVFRRRPDGWEVETYTGGETLQFESLTLSLDMAAVYEDIDRAGN